jgi:DNA repair exonuclease SbcCD ATPase subunit
MVAKEEYELVPVKPIERLEKRIKKLEEEREAISLRAFVSEIMDLVKSNQGLVDEIVKADDRLRDELAKLPGKIDELLNEWRDFISLLKEVSKVPAAKEAEALTTRFDRLLEQNEQMLTNQREILTALGAIKKRIGPSKPVKVYPKIKIPLRKGV